MNVVFSSHHCNKPSQASYLLPEHGLGHVHGHGLHAPIQPALPVLHPVYGFGQISGDAGAVGFGCFFKRLSQLGQFQIHHGQVNDVATENAVIGLTV